MADAADVQVFLEMVTQDPAKAQIIIENGAVKA
jgi:hypothetical protein